MDNRNKGLISLRAAQEAGAASQRTIIVSGVARSGTSMVARVLTGLGLFMGTERDDVVFEDHAFALLFERRPVDRDRLRALVAERDAAHPVWGFKRPHLHSYSPDLLAFFRNPLLVMTVRDPVAIAERNAISEWQEFDQSLRQAGADLQAMLAFADGLKYPTLMVSYEKALSDPEGFVARLSGFCGLDVTDEQCRNARLLIEPNRPEYCDQARRVFDGYIDGIEGNRLIGWACQTGYTGPLMLSVFRDGVRVGDVMADERREDLARAGIGEGRHGFSVDLTGLGLTRESRVSVRVTGLRHALKNSDLTLGELPTFGSADLWHKAVFA